MELRLFVYGSLLRGEPAHHLLDRARYLADASTAPGFALVDFVDWPGMLREGGAAVRGELFAVPAALVPALDRYEDHPAVFVREQIELADGTRAEAYLVRAERARDRPRIASGDWRRRR
jgi:gamma-glutamylcyclotransferase (GGCT)/AIG2-like uncharacterized protein YtfP